MEVPDFSLMSRTDMDLGFILDGEEYTVQSYPGVFSVGVLLFYQDVGQYGTFRSYMFLDMISLSIEAWVAIDGNNAADNIFLSFQSSSCLVSESDSGCSSVQIKRLSSTGQMKLAVILQGEEYFVLGPMFAGFEGYLCLTYSPIDSLFTFYTRSSASVDTTFSIYTLQVPTFLKWEDLTENYISSQETISMMVGIIDEFRVLDGLLTFTEISKSYEQGPDSKSKFVCIWIILFISLCVICWCLVFLQGEKAYELPEETTEVGKFLFTSNYTVEMEVYPMGTVNNSRATLLRCDYIMATTIGDFGTRNPDILFEEDSTVVSLRMISATDLEEFAVEKFISDVSLEMATWSRISVVVTDSPRTVQLLIRQLGFVVTVDVNGTVTNGTDPVIYNNTFSMLGRQPVNTINNIFIGGSDELPAARAAVRNIRVSAITSGFDTSFTAAPSAHPTSAPSGLPTGSPSGQPSCVPTSLPSSEPSGAPTSEPSGAPSERPISEPTGAPSALPSSNPSGVPSSAPTSAPTELPELPGSMLVLC